MLVWRIIIFFVENQFSKLSLKLGLSCVTSLSLRYSLHYVTRIRTDKDLIGHTLDLNEGFWVLETSTGGLLGSIFCGTLFIF
jgi:hypothetical protein